MPLPVLVEVVVVVIKVVEDTEVVLLVIVDDVEDVVDVLDVVVLVDGSPIASTQNDLLAGSVPHEEARDGF